MGGFGLNETVFVLALFVFGLVIIIFIDSFRRKPLGRKGKRAISYIFLISFALAILIPLGLLFMNSLKTGLEVYEDPLALPQDPQWSNYPDALNWPTFSIATGFKNSTIVVSITVLIIALIAPMAAYSLSRMEFRGRKFIFYFFMAGMFVGGPAIVAMLSLMMGLGLVNTYWALILPYVAGAMPFSILLMWTYFGAIPRALEDSAKVDGLSPFQTYWKVMLPQAFPALFTIVILQVIWIWNEFLLGLVMLRTPDMFTMPLMLTKFAAGTTSYMYFGIFAAGVFISALPLIIMYIVFSERIKRGMSMQFVKG